MPYLSTGKALSGEAAFSLIPLVGGFQRLLLKGVLRNAALKFGEVRHQLFVVPDPIGDLKL